MSDLVEESQVHVVGIGASAGGLEALEQFFDHMPSDSGMAFVVVQHLSPDFKSLMDELLARHTSMTITRAENGMPIEPDGIYLIPPKKNMVLSDGKLLLSEQDPSGGLNLPIDIFFRSLAQDARNRAIAIILSGTGSDGSRGIADVHEAGGLVAVQTAESAGFDGMPRNALATGLSHVACIPQEMPRHLLRYKEDPSAFFVASAAELDEPVLPGGELAAILALFRARYGIDFTLYREGTVQRRIERRMQLNGHKRYVDYAELLRHDGKELEGLYRDLLVEVTEFFRDSRAFERLRREVIPALLEQIVEPKEELRVWVAGCATGEEAYSIAMLLDDCALSMKKFPSIKVFATDVHRNSLEAGSAGVYSQESLAKVPEELRQRYFTLHGSLYYVGSELRKMVIFAPHNLSIDPPFTRIDLISCRNVLIYLKPEVQKRILSLFHFGLKVNGYLLLGSSETLGELSGEFDTVDQHWRIFRKLRDVRLREAVSISMAPPIGDVVKASSTPLVGMDSRTAESFWNVVVEDLLDRYVPPSFIVNKQSELIHSFGDARKVFVQPKGRSTLKVLKMVEGDLRMALSAALHRAGREQERVVLQGVKVETQSSTSLMQVTVEPYNKRGQELFLVCLEEMEDRRITYEPTAEPFRASDQAASRILDLEKELEFKTESLQTTVEELESSNEELQSTNEELVASNEELQSTNEELHSVNEELYTVNAEHQRKIEELTQLTADMDNLIRSTEIGTIFLDRDLRIRRFTPSITTAFKVLEQDIGRPIDQFAYHFESPNWVDKVRQVIETGEPCEMQLRLREGAEVFLKRINPFKTADGVIDGVVITFTNVSEIARAQSMEARRKHLERVAHDLENFVYAVAHDLQAPLRHVQTGILELKEVVSGNALDSRVAFLESKTRRLENMLQNLLEYSRINTRGKPFVRTDLGLVLDSVLSEMRSAIDSCGAQVTHDSLPTLLADEDQLKTVVWHLLDNALKYRSEEPPTIHWGAVQQEGEWVITIRDNGIGVLQQHAQDIFVIFRRLGFKEEVEGDGLGLALSKRIVERHGASIKAEHNEGAGTTFTIRWPTG